MSPPHQIAVIDVTGEMSPRPAPTGNRQYDPLVAMHCDWCDASGQAIGADGIRAWLAYREHTGKSPRTLGKDLAALKASYVQALADAGLNTADMLTFFDGLRKTLPTQQKERPKTLSADEYKKLLRALRSDLERTFTETLWVTGARVSELCGLTLDRCRGVQGSAAVELRLHGKGNKYRSAYVSAKQYARIRKHHGDTADPFLFRGPWGKHASGAVGPMRRQSVNAFLIRGARAAGIKRVTPHMFRHSFATRTLKGGLHIDVLQNLMGHTKLETTAIYLDPEIVPDDVVRIAGR